MTLEPGKKVAKTKVFISYSRKDIVFADHLVAALEARDIEVKIDRRDLPLLEEWQRELVGFIRQADAVVLIVSPNSMGSPWCEWEVQRIVEFNKRLAPVVLEPVPDSAIPEAVRKINFVFFNPPNDFSERADALVKALNTDIGWVKEHTRIGERARLWQEKGRPENLVIRGGELEDAERWIVSRPHEAPHPTELHRQFIQQSRRSQTQRWRTTVGALGFALVVTAGLAVAAFLFKLRADEQRDAAFISQSEFLADRSRQAFQQKDFSKSLALAYQGVPNDERLSSRPLVPETMVALQRAAYNIHEKRIVDVSGQFANSFTVWVNPDHLSPSRPDESKKDDVWFPYTQLRIGAASLHGPLWPWQLTSLEAKRQDLPASETTRQTPVRVVQAKGDNRVKVLDLATGKTLADLPGHDGPTYIAALSPDGKFLATAARGSVRARLWDVDKGTKVADLLQADEPAHAGDTPIADLEGYSSGPWAISFSADGSKIIIADGLKKTASIFDGRTGERVTTLGPIDQSITVAGLSSDGALAVTGSTDGTARLWRSNDAAPPRLIGRHDGPVAGAAFSQDGLHVVSYSLAGTALIQNTAREAPELKLKHKGPITDAQFSPDGNWIVTASADGTATVWDTRQGMSQAVMAGYLWNLQQACFSPDGLTVLTYEEGLEGIVREWDLTPRLAPALQGGDAFVIAANFTGDGKAVVTASPDAEMTFWDANTAKPRLRLRPKISYIDTFALSADGTKIFVGSVDGKARLLDATGKQIQEFLTETVSLRAAAFTPAGDIVAAVPARAPGQGVIILWSTQTGSEVKRIASPVLGAATKSLAFSNDGKRIIAADVLGSVKQWNVETGTEAEQIDEIPEALQVEQIAGHGGKIVRIDQQNNSRALLSENGSVERVVLEGGNSLTSVRLSPDGKNIAFGDAAGLVHIIGRTQDAKHITYAIAAKDARSNSNSVIVRFSVDGALIAAGSQQGDTYVLNASNGSVVAVLPGDVEVNDMAFSPADNRLITITRERLARMWWIPPSPYAFIQEASKLFPACQKLEKFENSVRALDAVAWCVNDGKLPKQLSAPGG